MTLQSILAVSAAGFSALYFLRGVIHDLSGASAPSGGSCGKCSPSGCPAARKG